MNRELQKYAREQLNIANISEEVICKIIDALNLGGVNSESVAKVLVKERLNEDDSFLCKHYFEDIFDYWQVKEPREAAAPALKTLKVLEIRKPPATKELYLLGLICGEKYNTHCMKTKKNLKFENKLYSAYGKYLEDFNDE